MNFSNGIVNVNFSQRFPWRYYLQGLNINICTQLAAVMSTPHSPSLPRLQLLNTWPSASIPASTMEMYSTRRRFNKSVLPHSSFKEIRYWMHIHYSKFLYSKSNCTHCKMLFSFISIISFKMHFTLFLSFKMKLKINPEVCKRPPLEKRWRELQTTHSFPQSRRRPLLGPSPGESTY